MKWIMQALLVVKLIAPLPKALKIVLLNILTVNISSVHH